MSNKIFTRHRLQQTVLLILLIQAKHQRLLIVLSEETGNLSPNVRLQAYHRAELSTKTQVFGEYLSCALLKDQLGDHLQAIKQVLSDDKSHVHTLHLPKH